MACWAPIRTARGTRRLESDAWHTALPARMTEDRRRVRRSVFGIPQIIFYGSLVFGVAEEILERVNQRDVTISRQHVHHLALSMRRAITKRLQGGRRLTGCGSTNP